MYNYFSLKLHSFSTSSHSVEKYFHFICILYIENIWQFIALVKNSLANHRSGNWRANTLNKNINKSNLSSGTILLLWKLNVYVSKSSTPFFLNSCRTFAYNYILSLQGYIVIPLEKQTTCGHTSCLHIWLKIVENISLFLQKFMETYLKALPFTYEQQTDFIIINNKNTTEHPLYVQILLSTVVLVYLLH